MIKKLVKKNIFLITTVTACIMVSFVGIDSVNTVFAAGNGGASNQSTSGGASSGTSGGAKNTNVSSSVPVKLKNPLKSELNTVPKIINAILDGIIIPIAVPIFVLAIIWSGILFVIARGNPKGIEDAKNALKWTLIGGAVILGSKLISSALAGTLGAITNTTIK